MLSLLASLGFVVLLGLATRAAADAPVWALVHAHQ